MPQLDINSAETGALAANRTIDSMNTDGVTEQDETAWQNDNWSQYWGYFNSLSELKSAIIMKAIWVVGKGYTADSETQVILDHISGWGKDTFEDILFNMEIIKRINGDAYAEIIRDSETNQLINLKCLDPSSIKIIVDSKGIIKRYEQHSKVKGQPIKKFEPNTIFHLSHNRLADQIHGISDIKALEKVILADNEYFEDMRQIIHNQARPLIMFKLGTDNASKIQTFKDKMDKALADGKNVYIPDDENSVSFEVVQVNPSQIVLEWGNNVKNKFYRSIGLPLVIFGQAGSTESGSKMEMFAHEQVFEHDQKILERQIYEQLNLKINLIPPQTLLENLQTDQNKDANQGMEIQQNDFMAGAGR